MKQQPMIIKFASQKCISYDHAPLYSASIIENVGMDNEGKWWKFTIENRWPNVENPRPYIHNRGDYVPATAPATDAAEGANEND